MFSILILLKFLKLRNLFETGSNSNGSWVKNKLTGKYKVFIPVVYFAQDQARVVSLPIKLSSNRYLVFTHTNLSWDGGNSNHFGIYNLTQTSFSAAYRGVAANISFMIEEY